MPTEPEPTYAVIVDNGLVTIVTTDPDPIPILIVDRDTEADPDRVNLIDLDGRNPLIVSVVFPDPDDTGLISDATAAGRPWSVPGRFATQPDS